MIRSIRVKDQFYTRTLWNEGAAGDNFKKLLSRSSSDLNTRSSENFEKMKKFFVAALAGGISATLFNKEQQAVCPGAKQAEYGDLIEGQSHLNHSTILP